MVKKTKSSIHCSLLFRVTYGRGALLCVGAKHRANWCVLCNDCAKTSGCIVGDLPLGMFCLDGFESLTQTEVAHGINKGL